MSNVHEGSLRAMRRLRQEWTMHKALSISHHINAPRSIVYRALLDPHAIAKWKVPNGMTCEVHALDAREGGSFRISLTYDAPTETGKTTARTDTTAAACEARAEPASYRSGRV
jgi:uncharacterized protein YndB with AHSA1/START domain